MKKITRLHLVFISVLMILVSPATAISIVSTGDTNALQNEHTTVPILVNNVSNLGSGTISITYDPSVVHVTDVTSGTGNALKVQDWKADNTVGDVRIIAWDVNAAHSGNVIFADVTYQTVGSQLSSTTLDISVMDLTDYHNYSQLGYTVSNGVFQILSSSKVDDNTHRKIFRNTAVKEVIEQHITKGSTVIYQFKKDANCINFVKFDARTDAGSLTMVIEILKDISTSVSTAPSDEVYRYMDIWFGRSGYATDENIANPVIGFKVARSWIAANNIDESTIRLNRYSDENWNSLATSLINEDADYLHFESTTRGFSSFAITAEKMKAETGGEGIVVEPAVGVEATEEIPEPTSQIPGFGLLSGLSVMLISMQILRKKR